MKLQIVRCKILNHQKLKLEYIDTNGKRTVRTISPEKLYLKNGSWYVEAYCDLRKEKRAFKLTRIRKMTPEYTKINVEMTDNSVANDWSVQTIVLHFHATQLGKLYDFFTENEIIQANEQQIIVQFQIKKDHNLLPFLLMFGSFVKVVQPEALKQAHYQAIQTMLTIYS